MEKLWKRLFFGLLALTIVGIIAFAIALDIFDQQGIHILGGYAHVGIRRDCYIIEVTEDGYSATEKSTLTVSGYLVDGHFDGYINLEAYPFAVGDYAQETGGYISGWNEITLYNHGLQSTRPEWKATFQIDIVKSNPDIIGVRITGRDGTSLLAICGETEEEAISNYKAYLEHLR